MEDLKPVETPRVVDLVEFLELMEHADFGDFLQPEAGFRIGQFFRGISIEADDFGIGAWYGAVTFSVDGQQGAAIYEITAPTGNDALLSHCSSKFSSEPDYETELNGVAHIFELDIEQDLSVIVGV